MLMMKMGVEEAKALPVLFPQFDWREEKGWYCVCCMFLAVADQIFCNLKKRSVTLFWFFG